MSLTITHSREKSYTGDFCAKVVIDDFQTAYTYKINFESYEKIISASPKKVVVESLPYIFGAQIYPLGSLAVNPSYVLIIKWIFDDESSEEDTYEDILIKGQWNLINKLFIAPSYDTKNLFYAELSLRVKYTVISATVTSYIDDVKFYPYLIDQTILTEDGRYWISILKGYQFIGGMGHRSVSYESHLDSIGVLRQIFIGKLPVAP